MPTVHLHTNHRLTRPQRQTLVRRLTEAVCAAVDKKPEDVTIYLYYHGGPHLDMAHGGALLSGRAARRPMATVYVEINDRRPPAHKRALAKRLTPVCVELLHCDPEDVSVRCRIVRWEDMARAGVMVSDRLARKALAAPARV